MRLGLILGMACLPVVASMADAASSSAGLKVGDRAPEFTMRGSDGRDHSLKEMKGKSWVVLAWFPKAGTRGWTIECESVRDTAAELDKFNVVYFTASVDDAEANRKFAESMGVKYPILSDPEKKVATAYGVLAPNGQFAQRWTYIIDDQGMVRAIDTGVKVGTHGADLVRMLRDLGAPMK